VIRLIHATDKTWCTVLYHHTMYVISLSNISIKPNFKQIARVELKCIPDHNSSLLRFVVILVNTTYSTWYKVLYHHTMYVMGMYICFHIEISLVFINKNHTMYVISLSNISIKPNFKQIARVELKCIQYSEGDYILCMTSRYFFRLFTNVRLLCFVSHSNGMT
jgi:ABC-type uncharacterized transport system YnjBCD permease subunit